MIDHEHKLIFIHIPKCAGTSMEVFLTGHDAADSEQKDHKHITARRARRLYGATLWGEYFTFSFVRNPWGRMVSWFNYLRVLEPTMEFEPWIRKVCRPWGLGYKLLPIHRSMSDYLVDRSGEVMVDYVGRFESLEEDFARMLDRAGVTAGELPKVEMGRYDSHYREWYTQETGDLVGRRFRNDVERFGYVF